MELELYQIKNMCMDMAELGAAHFAKYKYPGEDSISQREAYRMFGEARVKRWVSQDLLNPIRSGSTTRSKIIYSLAELITVEKAIKMHAVLNTK